MKIISSLVFVYLTSNFSMAAYTIKVPLEENLGSLPVNTIVFVNKSADPDPIDPNPTEPENTNCYYSLEQPFVSGFVERYFFGYYKETAYEGRQVINGTKGEVKETLTYEGQTTEIAEICFGPEGPIFKIADDDDMGWDVDDCRYNRDPKNVNNMDGVYYWEEVAGQGEYSDKRAFVHTYLGSRGLITPQSNDVEFPVGFINTPYGQIQPQDNVTLKRGSVYYSRGNHSVSWGNNRFFYEVCKRTVK